MKIGVNSNTIRYLLLTVLLTGCATGLIDYPRTRSTVIVDTNETRLGIDVAQWSRAYPGMPGFYPLVIGMDALRTRLALIAGNRSEHTGVSAVQPVGRVRTVRAGADGLVGTCVLSAAGRRRTKPAPADPAGRTATKARNADTANPSAGVLPVI